jgi:ribosomal protein S18 acetylase RimI-like enzyme
MPEQSADPPPGTFWVMELPGPPAPHGAATTPAEFARAGPEAAEEIAAVSESQPGEVLGRLAGGRRCYLARIAGTPVACGWVSFEQEGIGEQGLRVRLAPGEAYVWNCVTAPAYRRRGLYTLLLRHIAQALAAEGVRRVWIGADLDNVPSQKGMARAGFQPVLDLYTQRAGGRPELRVVGRPGVSSELLAEARRVLLGGGPEGD